jgi:hypothetical protein
MVVRDLATPPRDDSTKARVKQEADEAPKVIE